MKSRALALCKSRVDEIINKYDLEYTLNLAHKFLFELSELSDRQIKLLERSAQTFNIHKTKYSRTLLVVANDLNKSPDFSGDESLASFGSRIKQFFSAPVKPVWKLRKGRLDFNDAPVVMGILNVTPDSFYDGAKYNRVDKAVRHALDMVEKGARIIDIGGESTRPGAEAVPLDEELRRVVPVIKEIASQSDVLISVDTYKSRVAQAALDAGADMVNDISGGAFDKNMIPLIAAYQCPYIIMHIKGEPKNMQQNPRYDDVLRDIYFYFDEKIKQLTEKGIKNIVIDPGIGFGKRLQDNLHLIRDLQDFTFLNHPILVGASRKSMIGMVLDMQKEDRLYGSLAVHLQAVINGADIIRTHDVKATNETLQMFKAVDNPLNWLS